MDGGSYLRLQKILSIMVGQWKFEKSNRIIKIYNQFSNLLLIIFTFCTHFLLLTIVFHYKCKKAVFEVAFYYVHFIIAIILTILLKSSSIHKFLGWIITYEKTTVFRTKEEAGIYKYYSKMNNLFTIFCIIVINIVSWMWYIVGKRDSLLADFDPDCPFVRGSVFQIWYPFNIEQYQWICVAFDRITVFCGMMLFCYYKVTPLSLIIYLLSQISILKCSIRDIDNVNDETRKILGHENLKIARIRACLQTHQHCIKLMHWIQTSLKEIILIQYFSYVLDTAAFMIPILTEDSLEMKTRCFAGFTMTVLQMYFFFWFANEIQEESTSLSDIIYNDTDWVNAAESEKKMLMIMMHRSQQKMSLKAVAVGEMSLHSFTKIMRICYSVVTFFTTMYDE